MDLESGEKSMSTGDERLRSSDLWALIAATIIAAFGGYTVGKNSGAIPIRGAPLSQAKSQRAITVVGREGTNVLADGLDFTPRDVAETAELQKRQAAGEYILLNERPLMQKTKARHRERMVSAYQKEHAEEYGREFGSVGLDSTISSQLLTHLGRIMRASLEAESAIVQVEDARRAYDYRLHSLLSPDNYQKYREFEELKQARAEMVKLKAYFHQKAVTPISPVEDSNLVRLVYESKACDPNWWHGPFASLPEPRLGKDQVIALFESQCKELADAVKLLSEELPRLGLTEEQLNAANAYFQEKLAQKEANLAFIKSPAAEKPDLSSARTALTNSPAIPAEREPPVAGLRN
ncbi:MAG TPA: hypothetical protein VHH73_14080 [Verrucomicrobiae bacterium]|nr:hypothetical protein [Verrucomicrobiae bacterium]